MKIETILNELTLYEYFIEQPFIFLNIADDGQYLLYPLLLPFCIFWLIFLIISFPLIFIFTLRFIK